MTVVAIDPKKWQPNIEKAEDVEQPKAAATLPHLPDDFWDARESLRNIRQAARSALVGPDMVLLAILCRTSACADPDLVYDLGLGPGSLNLFGGLVGGTGIGKTTADRVARDVMLLPAALSLDLDARRANPEKFKDGIGVGTGEGLIEAYMDMVSVERERGGKLVRDKVRMQTRKHCYFFVDEGESLGQQMARDGATLGAIIRSAWPGAPVGQQNASAEKTRHLPAQSYAMGINIGFQPEIVQFLLADGAAGTPQRFLWLSGYDPDLPDEDVDPIRPFKCPVQDERGQLLTGVITGPSWIRTEMRAERRKVVRGKLVLDQLDSQKTAMLGKLAALIGLHDQRGELTFNDEDWQLAGVMWDTHEAIRDHLVEIGKAQLAKKARQRRDEAVDVALTSHQMVADDIAAVERVARFLHRKVTNSGALAITDLRRSLAGRDRKVPKLYERAVDFAQARDWLVVEDGKATVGAHRPAA